MEQYAGIDVSLEGVGSRFAAGTPPITERPRFCQDSCQ